MSMVKFKWTRKDADNEFEDFAGEEEYFNSFDDSDMADDGFSAGSLHTEPQAPAADAAYPFGAPANPASLKIVNPKGYSSAAEIADFLMNGNTVLLNIEGLTREVAVRLLDYLSGAVHVLGGVMTKVGKTTIVVAPKNVDVSNIEAMVGSVN